MTDLSDFTAMEQIRQKRGLPELPKSNANQRNHHMKITLPTITPGDWHVADKYAAITYIRALTQTKEAGFHEDYHGRIAGAFELPEKAETEANAVAIAAVPALLRALVSALEHFEGRAHYSPLQIRKADEIRAALTLAGCVIEP